MGAFFAGIVGETQDFIGTSEYVTSQDLINITDTQMNQAKILILGTILVFSCIVIVVGIFILHGAYEIFKSTISILVDSAVIDENIIREIVVEFSEIKYIKNIHEGKRDFRF